MKVVSVLGSSLDRNFYWKHLHFGSPIYTKHRRKELVVNILFFSLAPAFILYFVFSLIYEMFVYKH